MQKKVKEFNTMRCCHLQPMPIHARLLDIMSEMGELGKEYLKHSNYGTEEFKMDDEFKLELGDALYSLLSLADEANLDAEECLDMVLEKYRKRIQEKKSMGSGK